MNPLKKSAATLAAGTTLLFGGCTSGERAPVEYGSDFFSISVGMQVRQPSYGDPLLGQTSITSTGEVRFTGCNDVMSELPTQMRNREIPITNLKSVDVTLGELSCQAVEVVLPPSVQFKTGSTDLCEWIKGAIKGFPLEQSVDCLPTWYLRPDNSYHSKKHGALYLSSVIIND